MKRKKSIKSAEFCYSSDDSESKTNKFKLLQLSSSEESATATDEELSDVESISFDIHVTTKKTKPDQKTNSLDEEEKKSSESDSLRCG